MGATVLAGTRVPVDALVEYLEAGDRLDEFLRQFPTVSREQALGVLEMARHHARDGAVPRLRAPLGRGVPLGEQEDP